MHYNSVKASRAAVLACAWAKGEETVATQTYNAVTDLLDRNVENGRGDKLAFIDPYRRRTYRELQAESCRVAHLMRKLNIRQEQRVALIMLDSVDYPAVFLGAMRAGAVGHAVVSSRRNSCGLR